MAGAPSEERTLADIEGSLGTPMEPISVTPSVLGQTIQLGAFGDQIASPLKAQAGWTFAYKILEDFVNSTTSGGGATSSSDGVAMATSAVGAGASAAELATVKTLRYTPGIGALARFTAMFSEPLADSTMLIGIGDDMDGFFIGYDGTTFGVVRRRDGEDQFINRADWNDRLEEPDGAFVLNPQNFNVFQIRYQWLGAGAITFWAEDPATGGLVRFHQIEYANQFQSASILNPTLPVSMKIEKAGGAGAGTIELASMSAMGFSEGDPGMALANPKASGALTKSILAGVETVALIIRDKASVFGGASNNRAEMAMSLGSLVADGAKPVLFRFYKNGTLAGTAFTDVDADRSIAEVSTAGTIANGILVHTVLVGKDLADTYNLQPLDIQLQVGESLTVTGESDQNNDVSVSQSWSELF